MRSEKFYCHLPNKKNISACIYHSNAPGLPIIVVSGGPGLPYGYLENIADMLPNHPVIFYDPVGVGSSSPIENSADWNFNTFLDEINALQKSIHSNRFILLAHSAGTIPAVEYAIKYSHYLDSLILISPVISAAFYKKNLQRLITQFPSDIQARLNKLCIEKEIGTIETMEAMAHFSEKHVYRKSDWPDALLIASSQINSKMRDYLWGKNDFLLTGIWREYECLESLHLIQAKTFIVCGEYDFIDSDSCREYAKRIPNATFQLLKNVSHNPHLEDPAQFKQIMMHAFFNLSKAP